MLLEECRAKLSGKFEIDCSDKLNYMFYDQDHQLMAIVPKDQRSKVIFYNIHMSYPDMNAIAHFANTPLNERHGYQQHLTLTNDDIEALDTLNISDYVNPNCNTDVPMTTAQRIVLNKIKDQMQNYQSTLF